MQFRRGGICWSLLEVERVSMSARHRVLSTGSFWLSGKIYFIWWCHDGWKFLLGHLAWWLMNVLKTLESPKDRPTDPEKRQSSAIFFIDFQNLFAKFCGFTSKCHLSTCSFMCPKIKTIESNPPSQIPTGPGRLKTNFLCCLMPVAATFTPYLRIIFHTKIFYSPTRYDKCEGIPEATPRQPPDEIALNYVDIRRICIDDRKKL